MVSFLYMKSAINQNVPLYRRRVFWVIILTIHFFSAVTFFSSAILLLDAPENLLSSFLAITGQMTYYYIIFIILGHGSLTAILSTILYSFSTAILLYLSFRKKAVCLIYPTVYLVLATISCFLTYLLLTSFS